MRLIICFCFFFVFINSCSVTNENLEEMNHTLVQSLNDLDSTTNHNDTVRIEGYLQKYEYGSLVGGKGGGTQFFDYVITFADSTIIPIKNDVRIDKRYSGKYISLIGIASESPIHDDSSSYQNTGPFWQIQSVINIKLNEKTPPNKK